MWNYVGIVERWSDLANKFRVNVSVSNGTDEQIIMLKFQTDVTDAEVQLEAQKVIDNMNNPPVVNNNPSVESLQTELDRIKAALLANGIVV